MNNYQAVTTTQKEEGREQRIFTFQATQIIWLLVGILEALLALRFVFKLIGVNAGNAFAAMLYGFTGIFVAPFATLIGTPATDGMALEIFTIIAMLIYLLIAWGIAKAIEVLFYRPRGPVSVRQTVVDEHSPITTPVGASQTTVTESTNNVLHGPL